MTQITEIEQPIKERKVYGYRKGFSFCKEEDPSSRLNSDDWGMRYVYGETPGETEEKARNALGKHTKYHLFWYKTPQCIPVVGEITIIYEDQTGTDG